MDKEVSPDRFRISTYLSKTETIEKALKEAERFEVDKFYTKKKFIFRAP